MKMKSKEHLAKVEEKPNKDVDGFKNAILILFKLLWQVKRSFLSLWSALWGLYGIYFIYLFSFSCNERMVLYPIPVHSFIFLWHFSLAILWKGGSCN